jgi:lysophospholipase L1-like esterase
LLLNGGSANLTNITYNVYRYNAIDANWDRVGTDSVIPPADINADGSWQQFELADYGGNIDVQPGDCAYMELNGTGSGTTIPIYTHPYTSPHPDAGDPAAENDYSVIYTLNQGLPSTDATPANDYDGAIAIKAYGTSPVWAMMGDSTSIGVGGNGPIPYVYNGLNTGTWSTLDVESDLPSTLYAEAPATFATFAHIGISGSKMQAWAPGTYDHVNTYLIPLKPRYALIQLGANDASSGLDLATFREATIDVLQNLLANQITPVVCTPPPFDGGTAEQKALIQSYVAMLRDICNAWSLPYINTNAVLAAYDDPTSMRSASPDLHGSTVHPSDLGYIAMAQLIASNIRS